MDLTCKDCRFFLPVDVFKGICKISKEKITPDDRFCDKAEKVPKCKFCGKYLAEQDYLGKCIGNTMAFPDMIAAKCADFEWYTQN
ncbi:MAG: 4-hydroxyphenylacetate decarboxylase small subunit [Bacteroidales bacterium]|jgi:hypothetical protein|nr:4-hydroxyphenylacetate decarboxylase small subunit [Bacteroidales bacterium]